MIRWQFSVMFSRRFAVMSFRLMLFALCSVLHKVSSVPQGISDKKHNFVLCRAIFYLCGNRFRFLCFVISYKKAQKSRPAIIMFHGTYRRSALPLHGNQLNSFRFHLGILASSKISCGTRRR